MNSLLRTEWLKIKKYPAFWWMTGIVALTYPGINYGFYNTYQEVIGKNKGGPLSVIASMLSNPLAFPEVWHTAAYTSSIFVFIPAVMVIMFITNEYSYRTHRQNIIDGWSRDQFMMAKMTDVLLISLVATLMYMLIALVLGYINWSDGNGHVWEQTRYIWLFFLQTFSQLSIAFLIAFFTRKAFLALGIFIFYKEILENFFTMYARFKLNDIGRFFPFEISNRTIPPPAFTQIMRNKNDPDWYARRLSLMNEHIVYTILLIAITWGLCFWKNKRRDL